MSKRINFDSIYKKYANKTIKWLHNDNEENLQLHLKTRYNDLKDNGVLDIDISYKFNEHGFRCNNFTKDPTILFLGCSNTFGFALPLDKTWPQIVANHFGMQCANLAICGAGADTAFRLCLGYIDIIKPKAVVYLQPPNTRLELCLGDEIIPINMGSFTGGDYNVLVRQFFKVWLVGEENNVYFNSQKNNMALNFMCLKRNIPFIELNNDNFKCLDYARDLGHNGIKSNNNFAEHVIKEINTITNW